MNRPDHNRIWWLGGVALLALVIVGIQLRQHAAWRWVADFHHPFLAAAEIGEDAVAEGAMLLRNKRELARLATLLNQQNAMLRARLAASAELARENDDLRRILLLEPRLSFRPVYAEVRGRDPLDRLNPPEPLDPVGRQSLIINRGSESGIKVGAVVLCSLAAGGNEEAYGFAVVGRVTDVAKRSARVATIFNPLCQFSVRLAASGLCGLARGQGAARGAVGYLPRDGEARTGEMVLTSGYSAITPPGLLLGWVDGRPDGASETRTVDHLHQEAAYRAAADIDGVSILLVLTTMGEEHD